jgi:hypothetical protein
MSRLAVVAIVLLSLGFLVQASPIAAPTPEPGNEVANIQERGRSCYGRYCYGSLDLVSIMLQLQAAIEIKLGLLGASNSIIRHYIRSQYLFSYRRMSQWWRLRGYYS